MKQPIRKDWKSSFTSSRFAKNVGWNILGNLGGKVLAPLFQLLIARLLLPGDYGTFAIALAWLAIFEIGKDWGLTQAIVVHRGRNNAVAMQFTVQLATASVFYVVTILAAPAAATFFDLPQLALVLPLMGLAAFISVLADPLITECLMAQQYRRLAVRQMLMPLASGAVGLILAYQGYGVYALIFGLLFGHALGAAALYLGKESQLRFVLDRELLRKLMSVGKHIVFQRFFGFLVGHADSFIVGSALGSQSLGLYRMANMLAFLIPSAFVTQAQQVVFTELSESRDPVQMRNRYALFTNVGGASLFIYSVIVYLAAPGVVPLVLGAQWESAVPFLQVFAVVVVTGFLTPLNVDMAKVLGFVHIYTHFSAVRSICTILALFWASQYSTMHVVVTWVAVGFVATLANDAIFYLNQNAVRLTKAKIALTCASWAWASYVILALT